MSAARTAQAVAGEGWSAGPVEVVVRIRGSRCRPRVGLASAAAVHRAATATPAQTASVKIERHLEPGVAEGGQRRRELHHPGHHQEEPRRAGSGRRSSTTPPATAAPATRR